MKNFPHAACLKCIYRGSVPGDTHSCCRHPIAKDDIELMVAFALGYKNPLNIVADSYGIRMGWFAWPLNFDPTWLRNCDGFTEREAKE